MDHTPVFTIFTPTYNRAQTLPRLYKSIQNLTVRDFEWVIVDDGSNDGTEALVKQWQTEDNNFSIRYFWQTNQHKKVAFNHGVQKARGKWFVAIDSDDELTPACLEHFQKAWLSISESDHERFAGVMGLCVDDQGAIVGDSFPKDPLDASSVELFFDYKIQGEKFSCLRTDILRLFPFPEDIPDLVPESVVWFRISENYIQRCFNSAVRIYHRDVESITLPKDPLDARIKRAQGAVLSNIESLKHVTWRRLIRSPLRVFFLAVQYNRWTLYLPNSIRQKFRVQNAALKLFVHFLFPFGYMLYKSDQLRLTERIRHILSKFRIRN